MTALTKPNDLVAYFIWPCGSWCGEEDLEEYLTFMSDDYATVMLDAAVEDVSKELLKHL